MTFQYPYRKITDIKTANYTADLFDLVQYNTSGGTFTVTMPNDTNLAAKNSSLEHGSIIGFKNTEYNQTPLTVDASPNTIENILGFEATSIELDYERGAVGYYFDKPNTVWRRFGESESNFIPEPWIYTGADLLLGTNTDIPLTFQTDFLASPIFFQANTGNIECIRKFSGFVDLVCYIEFDAGANNQDGSFEVELHTVAGTPTLIQGLGMVGSSAVPRAGLYYEQRFLSAVVLASVGDIIGMRGSEGLGSTMDVSVISPTGLNARAV